MARLRKEVNSDFDQMDEGRDLYELGVATASDARTKGLKATTELNQRDYNKAVKNEDAEYKLIAY